MTHQRPYEDLSVFFAHSVTLELEASERLHELAATMDIHNNKELAELFKDLARYSESHGAEVERLSEKLCIPNMRAWDYTWPGNESPEVFGYENSHYLMSPKSALETALAVEMKAVHFYFDVAENSEDQQIRDYALQFAKEEQAHVAAVEQKICELDAQQQGQQMTAQGKVDFDPPNIPE